MGGEAPDLDGRLILFHEVLRPNDFTVGHIQAEQVPHGSQGVNLAVAVDGSRSWSGRVLYVIDAIIRMLPHNLAFGVVATEHAIFAGDLVLAEPAGGGLRLRAHAAVPDENRVSLHRPTRHAPA